MSLDASPTSVVGTPRGRCRPRGLRAVGRYAVTSPRLLGLSAIGSPTQPAGSYS